MTPAEIQSLRKRLGLTWSEIAAECRVSERTARYWVQKNGTEPGRFARQELARLERKAGKRDSHYEKDGV
jgi:DNA-binding transcriptional regulator YiaG